MREIRITGSGVLSFGISCLLVIGVLYGGAKMWQDDRAEGREDRLEAQIVTLSRKINVGQQALDLVTWPDQHANVLRQAGWTVADTTGAKR